MLEYKVSTDIVVPVILTVTSTGAAHTGVAFGSVTVTVIKANGTTATFTPLVAEWTEYSANAFAGSGYYNLTIPLAQTGVAGILQYGVSVAGDDLYFGVVALVANLESDTYTRIGAPVTSVSADIAAVKAQTQAIDTKTTNLPADPADASDVATAITAAVTSIKGASSKDLTQVEAETAAIKLKTDNLPADPADASDVAAAITAAVTSIKGAGAKDLTQVDTAVAAVQTTVTEMLGLLHKNAALDGQTYNAGGRLTGATLWVYDTPAHATTNDHVTGLLHSYAVTATYDLSDHQTLYRLTLLS